MRAKLNFVISYLLPLAAFVMGMTLPTDQFMGSSQPDDLPILGCFLFPMISVLIWVACEVFSLKVGRKARSIAWRACGKISPDNFETLRLNGSVVFLFIKIAGGVLSGLGCGLALRLLFTGHADNHDGLKMFTLGLGFLLGLKLAEVVQVKFNSKISSRRHIA